MINATAKFNVEKIRPNSYAEGYEHTRRMLDGIHQSAPEFFPVDGMWFGGMIKPGQTLIPFQDKDELLQRLQGLNEDGESSDYSIVLASTSGKRLPGRITLHYLPSFGYLTLTIYRPKEAAIDGLAVARMLEAVASIMKVDFAFVDVYARDPNGAEASDTTSYASSFATFPHRQCVGWMAYIPSDVTAELVPTAEALVRARGGTIVVAVKTYFDISNPAHIQAANQIEMDLADRDLLKVTDPSF